MNLCLLDDPDWLRQVLLEHLVGHQSVSVPLWEVWFGVEHKLLLSPEPGQLGTPGKVRLLIPMVVLDLAKVNRLDKKGSARLFLR